MDNALDPDWTGLDQDPPENRLLRAHLERIRLAHQKLLVEKARLEPTLLSLPATVLKDIPIERRTADRFDTLALEAQTMVDRSDEVAHEYERLAHSIRDLTDDNT
jgi:hypothetical protein